MNDHQTSKEFDILSDGLDAKTRQYSQLGIANAERNRPYIKQSIKELLGTADSKTCLVVSGGPSLLRRRSLERLKDIASAFVIVAADGALGHCLRAGLVPDYVASVDPHGERIVRWFGDDELDEAKLQDDYFRRQDIDAHLNTNEVEKNRELIHLVNEAGPKIKAILSSSASERVRQRCFDAGMDVYWWNPIYDDISDPASITRELFNNNGMPCMNTGGNVGSSASIFSARVLQARRVVMLGMDFAYYADTPIERTQYFDQFREFMTKTEIPHAFKTIRNPHLNEDYFTDPAYYWYRESFLELLPSFDGCEVINATEGGILFGDGISWMSIDEIIDMVKKETNNE